MFCITRETEWKNNAVRSESMTRLRKKKKEMKEKFEKILNYIRMREGINNEYQC